MAGARETCLVEPSPSALKDRSDEDDGGRRASAKLAGCQQKGSSVQECFTAESSVLPSSAVAR